MKKHLILLLLFSLSFNLVGFSAILPPSKDIKGAIDKNQIESIKQFSTMSFNEYEKMLGHKASKIEQFAFARMQKKTNKMFDSEGNLLEKYQKRFLKMYSEPGGSFVGGFALGFFLGVIGLILAYAVNNDGDKRNRIKGAWWGFIIQAILGIILIAAFLSTVETVTVI
jgi:hypothetical protein